MASILIDELQNAVCDIEFYLQVKIADFGTDFIGSEYLDMEELLPTICRHDEFIHSVCNPRLDIIELKQIVDFLINSPIQSYKWTKTFRVDIEKDNLLQRFMNAVLDSYDSEIFLELDRYLKTVLIAKIRNIQTDFGDRIVRIGGEGYFKDQIKINLLKETVTELNRCLAIFRANDLNDSETSMFEFRNLFIKWDIDKSVICFYLFDNLDELIKDYICVIIGYAISQKLKSSLFVYEEIALKYDIIIISRDLIETDLNEDTILLSKINALIKLLKSNFDLKEHIDKLEVFFIKCTNRIFKGISEIQDVDFDIFRETLNQILQIFSN